MIQIGSPIGEPLVTDRRLEKVAGRLRKEHPLLPEDSQFVTFHQSATYAAADDGILRPIPDVAVFGIQVPHPKESGRPCLHARSTTLDAWRLWERESRHNGEIEADPLYLVFTVKIDGMNLVERAIDWWVNARDLKTTKVQ